MPHIPSRASSRRSFLRGLGVCLGLPAMESFSPLVKAAANPSRLAATASGQPLRMAFVAFANGSNYERWLPSGEGRDYAMNETFIPMKALRDKFQIITNLAHDTANNWGDGTGDHARSGASFLTGCHAWKTMGSRLHLGISVDQIAARQVGHLTRLDSLQLGVEGARLYGSCDTGYPCAYQYNISWASESLPLAPEPNPRAVFEKLFGGGTAGERSGNLKERLTRRKSVLDFVLEDARSLERDLGRNDRQKLDEFLSGIRRIEQQIGKAEQFALPSAAIPQPGGIPGDHLVHVDLMYDLMALAFQTDSTRVVSFSVAPEGSNRPFLDLGISEGHHFLTHHSGNQEKILKVAKIERWYMERFARFLTTLDGMKDADGSSVLDNSMIVYGCAIGDGNKHNHDELPIVLAGGGGGTLTPGRHLKLKDSTPMTNLYTAILDRAGINAERVGDSTGKLEGVLMPRAPVMKRSIDPAEYRFTGKGSCHPHKLPTKLKKRLYRDDGSLEEQLREFREEIDDLQQKMIAHDRYSMLLIFQAMDAAGKDGTIKHVMSGINPHGVEIHSFKRPSDEELDHDYLWRTSKLLPPRGKIGIFNRSYYEEVLVCRVHPEIVTQFQRLPEDATKDIDKLWPRRFAEIKNFEATLYANGTRVVKFFLNVSKQEQKKRLLGRIDTPSKNWKFNASDLKERALWSDYMKAYGEAIDATATRDSPWYVIPADDKGDMRLITGAAILHEIRRLKLKWPVLPGEQLKGLATAREALLAEK